MFNETYVAETLRIARVTCTKAIFINHYSTAIFRLINQGENVSTISKTLSKTFGRHFQTFSKFYARLLGFINFSHP